MAASVPAREPRVVVVGAGLAGLATALALAPMPVTVLSASPPGGECATAWAQGGIAAALGPNDHPARHARDTVAVGGGLVDTGIADRTAGAAAACIEGLAALGVAFDRDTAGRAALGLEAGHSHRRIVHAAGDGTGRAVLRALLAAARAAPSIELLAGARAVALRHGEHGVDAVRLARHGSVHAIPARAVVLATGGLGGLYADTTNPLACHGLGIALAARAGATIRNAEFVQFHPTAMDLGTDPMALASEAVRGEGAVLTTAHGARVMAGIAGGDLAPRDVVARAIARRLARGERVYLDARAALGPGLARRFPAVTALCRAQGLDPVRQPIPVRPAAHYHMGGVAVDAAGRSDVPGLWACGEVAATGLHGANRLASNSLLEGLAFAHWIAADIAGRPAPLSLRHCGERDAAESAAAAGAAPAWLRRLMSDCVGIERDAAGLARACAILAGAAFPGGPRGEAGGDAPSEAALAALFVAAAAMRRCESRGAHMRRDHPESDPAQARCSRLRLADLRALAGELEAVSQ